MATQTEWDADVFNVASFVGGIVATLVFAFMLYAVWLVAIGPYIDRVRAERRQREQYRIEVLREQIRAEVLAALEHGNEDEIDPDDFKGDMDDDPARPGSGRPD